jgi:hypothetical protein
MGQCLFCEWDSGAKDFCCPSCEEAYGAGEKCLESIKEAYHLAEELTRETCRRCGGTGLQPITRASSMPGVGSMQTVPMPLTKEKSPGEKPSWRYARIGGVYLVEAENGLFKIGMSENIMSRFGALANASPLELKLVCYVECENARCIEAYLHERFQAKRVRGEWFRLDGDDIIWLKREVFTS